MRRRPPVVGSLEGWHRVSRPAARRTAVALAGAALAAIAASTAPVAAPAVPGPEGPPATSPAARPSLVLVTLDTTRADHLGSYGWTYAKTPNLDALARRGVRFARCDTAAPITLPSHATLLTGLYPLRHGVRDNGIFALPAGVETVATRLAAAGYDTAAVVSAVVLARRHGLDRGFRIYDDDLGADTAAAGGGQGPASERSAEATTAAALAALARLRSPFFLWVHYFDPHEDYRPPERFAGLGGPTPLYDGEIAYVDEQLGALFRALPAGTAVAVVADHGEMLDEHGESTHGLLPYRAARRVPLILAGPGAPAGRVDECLVRTADVAPTLLAWAGVAAPGGLDGAPLLPLAPTTASTSSPGCDRTSYTESFLPYFAYGWYPLRTLSDGRSLYLRGPRPSLYSLPDDPAEEHDLAAGRPAETAAWERRLRGLVGAAHESLDDPAAVAGAATSVDSDLARRLASLGYLSGGGTGAGATGGRAADSLPDPRERTAEAKRIHRLAARLRDGDCAAALAELERLAADDPHDFTLLSMTGECLRDLARPAEALTWFRRAEREAPRSAVPVASAAGSLLALGREDEAIEEHRRALALDPSLAASAANLARLLRGRNDPAGAREVLSRALAAGSHSPEVWMEQGLALVDLGRLDEALGSFREAARRNPGDPAPLEDAGHAAFQLGKFVEAVRLYEEALRRAPDRGDLWKTLGAVYLVQLDDGAEALRAFRAALALETDPGERTRLEEVIEELSE